MFAPMKSTSSWKIGHLGSKTRSPGQIKGVLALVAQLDARQTGDQEVAGSTPFRSAKEVAGSTLTGSVTFFHGD